MTHTYHFMKNFLPVFLVACLCLLFFAFQCEDQNLRKEQVDCIDTSKIRNDAVCYMIYDPVCGCDKKTYSNDCVATNAGVMKFTKGECGK